jgi:hypothetical protein
VGQPNDTLGSGEWIWRASVLAECRRREATLWSDVSNIDRRRHADKIKRNDCLGRTRKLQKNDCFLTTSVCQHGGKKNAAPTRRVFMKFDISRILRKLCRENFTFHYNLTRIEGILQKTYVYLCGPGWLSRYSDWLRAGRYGDRIPVVARFSAPVQTGPGAHPASCTMGTGSFPGVKSGRGMMLTPHPLLVQ